MFHYGSIYNPFPYINHTVPENNITNYNDENPNLHHTSQLPTLVQDGLLLSHLLSQQQLLATTSQADHSETSFLGWNQALNMNKSCSESRQKTIPIPRKRSGKKDRHSKICTAQGPRDRRMRLSLQIARKFFDLQDMLGFDKASKTIDWLFHKSMTAINELKCCKIGAQCSSTSDQSEVVSTTMEAEFFSSVREKKNRKLCMVGKESRDKARARARERTIMKMKIRGDLENSRLQYTDQTGNKDSYSRRLWESKSLETGEESRRHCNREMSYNVRMVTEADLEEPAVDVELPDDHVGSVKLSGLIYDDHNHSQQQIAVSSGATSEDGFLGFPGNWDGNYNSKLQESFSCTMTNTRRFTATGNVQVQNPCEIFMTNTTTQEEKPSSIFLTTSDTSQELNPSSVFMTTTLNCADHEKNPGSNLVHTSNIFWQSQFLDNQFTYNPTISNENHISY